MADDLTTKPTLETIPERINALGEKIDVGFEQINKRLDSLDRRIGVLSKDLVDVRAALAGMDARITTLESSPRP